MKAFTTVAGSLLLASCAGLAVLGACSDSSSGGAPGTTDLPDATPYDASGAQGDGGGDAGLAADTYVPDVVADVQPPRQCLDAGAGVDAGGCLLALTLFNTGVDSTGTVLDGGSVDPHYTLTQSADSNYPGPNAIVTTQIADGYWVPQSATSKWIAPTADQSYPTTPTPCDASGVYVYRTSFSLAGFVPSTARIDGQWGADNSGTDIRLNGVTIGATPTGYAPLSPFTITSGFVAGTNTLDFQLTDIGCPNGLRVELTGSAVAQ